MLKAAIEKILSLDAPHIEEIEGRTYVDKDMTQVPCLRQTEAHGRMRRKPTSKRISKKNLRMYQTFS